LRSLRFSLGRLARLPEAVTLARIYREVYLTRHRDFDAAALAAVQKAKLRALVRQAARFVRFYERRFLAAGIDPSSVEDIAALRPAGVLTKADLRSRFADLLADNMRPNLGRYQLQRSSGTTGTRTVAFQDKAYRVAVCSDVIKELLAYGVDVGSRIMVVNGNTPDPRAIRPAMLFCRTWGFSFYNDSREPLEDMRPNLERAVKFNPRYIIGSPSYMMMLCRLVRDQGITSLRPKLILSDWETLFDCFRKYISETFGVPVMDMYGASEVGHVAWQCPGGGGYHIHSDNVIVEILNERDEPARPGETGNLVITNLNNHIMPLIRYQVGDMGAFTDATCPCGRHLPLLRNVVGRSFDMVVLPGGGFANPAELIRIMYRYAAPEQFHISQENERLLVIEYDRRLQFSGERLEQIRTEYMHLVGPPMEVRLEPREEAYFLDARRRGRKLQYISSKVSAGA
jgi:phenylacetate-CoA ligase